MKYLKSFLVVLLALVLTSGVAMAQKLNKQFNVDNSNIALKGYSPVSYIDLNLAQEGVKAHKTEYKGLNYYFKDADQKAKFDANPQKYLPQYGGWCATGIAVGAYFRTDPNKFLVENGKLYLFLSNLEVDALELWQKDAKGMTKKADTNWKKMAK